MLGWLFGKIKWLLIIAAIGGPGLAFFSWQDAERRKTVMADGIETEATIEGATRTKGRRSGTSYKIDLSWTDAQGKARTAKDIGISRSYADKIIIADKLMAGTTRIRYLAEPGESENLIVSADENAQETTDQEMIYVGGGAGAVGLAGLALIFLVGRRRQQVQTA